MKELQIGDTGGIPVPDKTFEYLREAYNQALDLRVSLCEASYHLRADPDGVRDRISALEKTVRTVSMTLDDMLDLEEDE